jgi:general secretion pathway protein G
MAHRLLLGRQWRGFTLIELLVVLAALALLLGIAVPRYVEHVDRAREAVLRQNLAALRDAIDKFNADRGRYPADLAELARERYLREVPRDPLTDRSDSWILVQPPQGAEGKVYDVHSGAPGQGRDGKPYATW